MLTLNKWWMKNTTYVIASWTLLFASAGDFLWVAAWLYVFMLLCNVFIMRNVLHPELLTIRSMLVDGTKKWDLLTAPVVSIIGPLNICLFAGLDHRMGWTQAEPLIQVVACFLFILGASLVFWAMKTNPYYTQTVRFQYERYHVIITEGPYRFVRHPGYTGSILMTLATPLILGSWAALIPSVFLAIVHILRTVLEDITLQRQFKGYYNYTKKVPYRLLPGIW